MKTALVTGAAGFVGRHMTAELERRSWAVIEVDIDDRAGGEDALDVFRRDITGYDLVVHCAARAPHRAAIDGDPTTMSYNLQLDSAMFEWAVRTKQRRVLYLSSSAAYPVGPQAGHVPYRMHELDLDPMASISTDLLKAMGSMGPLLPDAGYGWTKLTGERMATLAATTGLAVHVVRPFSGYGEDQGTDWPFGAFADRASRGEDPFTIWGNGRQVRDWIHIDDVVGGALAVVEADDRRPVNLCTGRGTSMLELAQMMCDEAKFRPDFDLKPDAPSGVAYRVGDPSRFHQLYKPKVSIEEGVTRALRGLALR
jgi:nucleoside-diphosphate-sugar epimerase